MVADGSHVGDLGSHRGNQLQEWIPFHQEPCSIAYISDVKHHIDVIYSFRQSVDHPYRSWLHIPWVYISEAALTHKIPTFEESKIDRFSLPLWIYRVNLYLHIVLACIVTLCLAHVTIHHHTHRTRTSCWRSLEVCALAPSHSSTSLPKWFERFQVR